MKPILNRIISFALHARQFSRRHEAAIFVATGAALLLWLSPLTVPGRDTETYLDWNPGRAPLFPMIYFPLRAVAGETLSIMAMAITQTALATAAILLLVRQCAKRLGIAAAAATLAAMVYALYKFNWLQSEPLSIAATAAAMSIAIGLAYSFSWKRWTTLCALAAAATLLRPQFVYWYGVLAVMAAYQLRADKRAVIKALAIVLVFAIGAVLAENSINAARFGFFDRHKRMYSHVGSVLLFISDGYGDLKLFEQSADYPVIKGIYEQMRERGLFRDSGFLVRCGEVSYYFESIRAPMDELISHGYGYTSPVRQDELWRQITRTLLAKYHTRFLLYIITGSALALFTPWWQFCLIAAVMLGGALLFLKPGREPEKTLLIAAAAGMCLNFMLIAATTGIFYPHYTVYSVLPLATAAAALIRKPS